ncbi:CvpA family protein [Staphylococcus gallinarum]|uniref:CvpA family protein n=1 Tax=Staphylococcus gallinarum TaxID=1293 RepID=UPI0022B3179C|nr:CvpA family protein [Staphylococcus gallinarum]MCD8917841.1 CvpA family protein [Staphylococcus gallinarum]
MLIDLLIIVIFLYIGMIGFRRGVWLSIMHLGATILSLYIAQKCFIKLSQYLELFIPFPKTRAYDMHFAFQFDNLQLRFDHLVAFLIVATITKVLCYAIIVCFDNIIKYKKMFMLSRLIGVLLSIVSSIIICTTLIYAMALYPLSIIQTQLSKSFIAEILISHIPFISTFVVNI